MESGKESGLKTLLIACLELTALQALIIPTTNTVAFFSARSRIQEQGSVQEAKKEIERKRDDLTGFPHDQIRTVYFGLGEKIAYFTHEEKIY